MDNCAILMVHMVSDECCGVSCFPHWHAEFERHVAQQGRKSGLIGVNLPCGHNAASPLWHQWQMHSHPVLNWWFDMMWEMLVIGGR